MGIFFKERNPYSTYNSVEEFCNKHKFRYDKENKIIIKEIKDEIIKFDSLIDYFTNIEQVLKEDYDEKYSHGIYLKEIKYKIINMIGVIQG
jgi:hypothetical protein